jgi:hypothetical protein
VYGGVAWLLAPMLATQAYHWHMDTLDNMLYNA